MADDIGRLCPTDYRYRPESFRRPPDLDAETLLVAGGLYGNLRAADALAAARAREPGPVAVVLNGDFNWFDADPGRFRRINEFALGEVALRGNVETEMARETAGHGCGCAYPDWVSESVVRDSNAIMTRLQEVARGCPDLLRRLAGLPMNLVAAVGRLRVAIVHGDAHSLAGWDFSRESLSGASPGEEVAHSFAEAGVRLFASSHTGLPIARSFATAEGPAAVFNNGAAGLPNFAGTRFGVVTRISTRPPPEPGLYGMRIAGVHVDALPLRYDAAAWRDDFLAVWPPGSVAHRAYFQRIEDGPEHTVEAAAGAGVRRGGRRVPRRSGPG